MVVFGLPAGSMLSSDCSSTQTVIYFDPFPFFCFSKLWFVPCWVFYALPLFHLYDIFPHVSLLRPEVKSFAFVAGFSFSKLHVFA